MASPINPIGPIAGIGLGSTSAVTGKKSEGFQDLLNNAIANVENQKQTADQGIERFLAGDGEDLHSVVMATQKAELSFDLFLQVRNKVVSAYQEIMRMQI